MLASRIFRSIASGITKRKMSLRKPDELTLEKSPFGSIPLNTYKIFLSHAKDSNGPIACYLPLDVSKELRDFTVKEVLSTLLRDCLENKNDEPLSQRDIEDFGAFIELSYALANGNRAAALAVEEIAIYRACLRALLEDWLHNWNAPDASGKFYPPD